MANLKHISLCFFVIVCLLASPAFAQKKAGGGGGSSQGTFISKIAPQLSDIGADYCKTDASGRNFFGQPSQCIPAQGDTLGAIDCLVPNVVSQFEALIGEIFSTLYCGIQTAFLPVLGAVMTLFILAFGVLFLIGAVELSAGEALTRLLKLALVWMFATNAQYGIGIAYNLLTTIPKEGMEMVLDTLVTDEDIKNAPEEEKVGVALERPLQIILPLPRALQSKGDEINSASLSGEGSGDIMKIMLLLTVFMMFLPPIFALVAGFFIQIIITFVRTFTAYLLSIAGIAFLLTLAPLFLSFALFETTKSYFERWLKYLASFAIQIIIIFAFLALLQLLNPADFLKRLITASYPYTVEMRFAYEVFHEDVPGTSKSIALSYPLKASNIVLWSVCRNPVIPADEILSNDNSAVESISCKPPPESGSAEYELSDYWLYNPYCGNFETPSTQPSKLDGTDLTDETRKQVKLLTYADIGLDGQNPDDKKTLNKEEEKALKAFGISADSLHPYDDNGSIDRAKDLAEKAHADKNLYEHDDNGNLVKDDDKNPVGMPIFLRLPDYDEKTGIRTYHTGSVPQTGIPACYVKLDSNNNWAPIARCEDNTSSVNGQCGGSKPVYNVMPIFDLVQNAEFLKFLVIAIIAFFMLLYVMEAALRNMPEIAKRLSGLDESGMGLGGAGPEGLRPGGSGSGAIGALLKSKSSLQHINTSSIKTAIGNAWSRPKIR